MAAEEDRPAEGQTEKAIRPQENIIKGFSRATLQAKGKAETPKDGNGPNLEAIPALNKGSKQISCSPAMSEVSALSDKDSYLTYFYAAVVQKWHVLIIKESSVVDTNLASLYMTKTFLEAWDKQPHPQS